MSLASYTSRVRRGFTLVELLVVIGIVGVLISILLPVMSKARRQAANVVCMSNLRQQGIAWHNYLSESRGRFPKWYANLQRFYGGREPSIVTYNPAVPSPQDRLLNPYLGLKASTRGPDRPEHIQDRAEIFRCPSDDEIVNRANAVSLTKGYPCFEYYGNSYYMNWNLLYQLGPGGKVPVVLKMVQLPHSQVILAGDTHWYYALNNNADTIQWNADFHKQAPYVNLVFLDGHAARTRIVPETTFTQDYSVSIKRPLPDKETP